MADGIASATHGELAAHKGDVPVSRSVTIDRPREELYAFWRNFNNLPLFMRNIHSVAEVTDDDPNRLIAWRLEGAGVCNSGRVEFRDSPDSRGTVVTVTQEPQCQVRNDLRRFKQLMETGEVSTAQSPERRRTHSSTAAH